MPKLVGTPAFDTSHAFVSGRLHAGYAWNPLTSVVRRVAGGTVTDLTILSGGASAGTIATDYGTFGTDIGNWRDTSFPTPATDAKFWFGWFPRSDPGSVAGATVVRAGTGSTPEDYLILRTFATPTRWQFETSWDTNPPTGAVDSFSSQFSATDDEPLAFGAVLNDAGLNFGWKVRLRHGDPGGTPSDWTTVSAGDNNADASEIAHPFVPSGHLLYADFGDPTIPFGYMVFLDEVPTGAEFDSLYADPLSIFGTAPTVQSITRLSDTVLRVVWDVACTAVSADYTIRDSLGGFVYPSGGYTVSGSGGTTHDITRGAGWSSQPSVAVNEDDAVNTFGRGNNAYSETLVTLPALTGGLVRSTRVTKYRGRNPR